MAVRTPRGYERNRPNYQELCEGVRPVDTAMPREAYTGLPHVRVDTHHNDPIVIDPGTIVGRVSWTGAASDMIGKIVPAVLPTATGSATDADTVLKIYGSAEAASTWGLPAGESGQLAVGLVKPIGVVAQPVYSFILQSRWTNYTRNVNVGIVTDYVIMVPAINSEEHAIRDGDVVVLGSGNHYGAGWSAPSTSHLSAGRYAAYDATEAFANERVIGRCLKKIKIANYDAGTAGATLNATVGLSAFALSTEAAAEFQDMDKVQTVPGMGLTGSATKGVPAWLLDATLDDGTNDTSGKAFWALVILVRL